MSYPIFGNVSLGSVIGNIKLYVNHSGVNNLTGIGYNIFGLDNRNRGVN
jgi:hypothetical protein